MLQFFRTFLIIITILFNLPLCWAATDTPPSTPAPPDITKLTFHGHSAFEITTPLGKVLMVDPWLRNPVNPNAHEGKDPLEKVEKLDFILVTHGHYDHIGDAVELSNKTKARLVTSFELGGNMAHLLNYPKFNMRYANLMNIGGEITIADGEVTIAMTPAVHSSGIENQQANRRQSLYAYGGNPAGFVIMIKNGPAIYHAGDTAYFRDMETIGEQYAPDIALLPVGGQFVMEPAMAAKAAAAVKAKLAIPMHYGTFPVLHQKPDQFIAALTERAIPYKVMKPGSTITFKGKTLQ